MGGFWKSVFQTGYLHFLIINVLAEGSGASLGFHFTAYTINVSIFPVHALRLSVSLATKLGVCLVGTRSAGSASENHPLRVINLIYFCPSCI